MATKEASTTPTEGRRLLTYEEAAAYLGPSFTPRRVKQWANDGRDQERASWPRHFHEQRELDNFVKREAARARQTRARRSEHARKANAARADRKARRS